MKVKKVQLKQLTNKYCLLQNHFILKYLIIFVLFSSFCGLLIALLKNDIRDDDVNCPQEAKACPNGSYVGRTSPGCKFAVCPTPSSEPIPIVIPTNWKTYKNDKYGFSFKYPPDWTITNSKTHLYGVLSNDNIKKHIEYFEISPTKEVNYYENYKKYPNSLTIEINSVFNNGKVNDEKFICIGQIDSMDCSRFILPQYIYFFNIGDFKFAEYSTGFDDWFNQMSIIRYFKIGNTPNTITSHLYMNSFDYLECKDFFDQIGSVNSCV